MNQSNKTDPETGQATAAQPVTQPAPANKPKALRVAPVARPATIKRRHRGVYYSFLLIVVLPVFLAAAYLLALAEDQYASTTAFTVRQEEGASAGVLGDLTQFVGGSSASDADVLYEYIQSQEMVQNIDARADLAALYSGPWPRDPLFALWPDATIEDMLWYWRRIVRISYDQSTGLIELRVLAFSPDTARALAEMITEESQRLINGLNTTAREDMMRYAIGDLNIALERLREARQALTEFRTRTRIVDPSVDIQGRMGVLSNLQQQLTEALIERDLLRDTTRENDPRVQQAERRIAVIEERITTERETLVLADAANGGDDYPTLISEYEGLVVDSEFAAGTYTVALAALDLARSNANRQTRYLATYIHPTTAQSAEFPRRPVIVGLIFLFALLTWSVAVLVYYSLRDRR